MARRLTLALLLLSLALSAHARVTRIEVLSRVSIPAGSPSAATPDPASAGPVFPGLEKITARVYFAIKPNDPRNTRIVDLDKAPRNSDGEVEFSSDLLLIRPLTGANNALLLEIPNRGGAGLLSLLDGGSGHPAKLSETGDSWLLRQGFAIASLGWQWDAPDGLRLYAPIAHDAGGKTITGLLRSDFTLAAPAHDLPLGHIMGARIGGTEYPAAAPTDPRNVLTIRDTPHGPRRIIPRAEWSFARTENEALTPNSHSLHLNSGFQPGKIYELVYVVQDPVVAGLGFAAIRDFTSWIKHPSAGEPEPPATARVVYAAGISQCARFLRDFLYEGFNAGDQNQIVLDGVLAHVSGAGRGSFNYRFAQPSRDAQPVSSIDYPTDIFPFTGLPESDPDHPTAPKAGILSAAVAANVVPKIFFSHTSYEYWGRAASLMHTTADGKTDAPLHDNVRIYFYSGLQHYSVAFPPQKETGDGDSQELPSPLPIRWFWRAMVANMDAWVQHNTPPPASRYPRIADQTLVPIDQLHFPKIPGLRLPTSASQGEDLDFGPDWRAGLLTRQPPKVAGFYPTLVPQVDSDGNDLGGIRLPEQAVPLATYTGWNLRSPAIGAPQERTSFLGSFIPFERNTSDALERHDPRPAIDKRYKNYADYRQHFQQSLEALIKDRYLLSEDAEPLMERSKQEWDWITAGNIPDPMKP
ncbi:MAG TPA: alpha/beta hydrolase domain-containing protein [Acidobacteriaceae bacterium]|nr:alpha/beta hydrolase domain-containing protein [Acidobacteriaceae bacterium]